MIEPRWESACAENGDELSARCRNLVIMNLDKLIFTYRNLLLLINPYIYMQITLLLYRSSKQAGWDLDRGGGLVVSQSSLADHDGPKSNRTTTVRKMLGCELIWKKISVKPWALVPMLETTPDIDIDWLYLYYRYISDDITRLIVGVITDWVSQC